MKNRTFLPYTFVLHVKRNITTRLTATAPTKPYLLSESNFLHFFPMSAFPSIRGWCPACFMQTLVVVQVGQPSTEKEKKTENKHFWSPTAGPYPYCRSGVCERRPDEPTPPRVAKKSNGWKTASARLAEEAGERKNTRPGSVSAVLPDVPRGRPGDYHGDGRQAGAPPNRSDT